MHCPMTSIQTDNRNSWGLDQQAWVWTAAMPTCRVISRCSHLTVCNLKYMTMYVAIVSKSVNIESLQQKHVWIQ